MDSSNDRIKLCQGSRRCSAPLLYAWQREGSDMFAPKGYYTSQGFVGILPDGTRMFFPTAEEYYEYLEEQAA